MSGIDLANQYRENKAKIEAIWADYEKFKDVKDHESREMSRSYREKIWALQDEERRKACAIEQAKDERRVMAESETHELNKVIDKVTKIVYFLMLKPNAVWNKELEPYGGKELVHLGSLYLDEFMDLRLFAVENGRPKNVWTLAAIGRCAFDRSVLDLPRGYLHINDYSAGINVIGIIEHLPTMEAMEKYRAKNKGKLMKGFLESFQQVKGAYLDAVKNYKLEDFAGIEPLFGLT